jgi:lipopolysaccharide biosynthesis regulator YciM
LEFLLELFQKEHDWLKAIDIAHQLTALSNEPRYRSQAAFFYCELAAEEIAQQNIATAREHLELALQEDANSVRATLMLGDLLLAEQHAEAAIAMWQRIETQNPDYLPLVAERLLNSYRSLDKEADGIALLRTYLEKYHALDLMNVLFDGVLKHEGATAAYQLVRAELERNPSLLGLDKLLEARLLEVPMDRRADVELVKNLIHQRTRSLAAYQCGHCGFKARQFYWHCPACQTWDSYPPRRSEETGISL